MAGDLDTMDIDVKQLSPKKKNKQGQFVNKRERLVIVNLYKDLQTENPRITKRKAHGILSEKTGFGIFSVKNALLQWERTGTVTSPNKKKPRLLCNKLVDEFVRNAIRRKVHGFYINKELPTLAKVLQAVNDDEDLPNFKRTTFWKLLKELNFTFVGRQRNSVLVERDDLILWRRNYLRSVRKFREEGRPIYYLDETWVNAGLSTGPNNLSGKQGKRLIVLHIGSMAGFVPGGLLWFESKNNTADYHDEFNGDKFLEWFEKILPLLEDNAVIILDNAPYHSVKTEKVPNSSWNKSSIIEWLQTKGKATDMSVLKAELLEMVGHLKEKFDKYIVDEMAKKHNKTVLRLPPYHCELNPIEMVWSMVKGRVKTHNNTFKINDAKILLEQGVERVTSEHWGNFVTHVIKEEEKFWEFDTISDRMIDDMLSLIVDFSNESASDTDSDD